MLSIALHITSDTLHPDAMTAIMGLAPTWAYVKDKSRWKGTRARWHEYELEHALTETEGQVNLTSNLRDFISTLLHYKDQLAQLAQHCDLAVSCEADTRQGFVTWRVENDVLQQMAALGVELDITVYKQHEPTSS